MANEIITIENRTWNIEPMTTGDATASSLEARGFVGQMFIGTSTPIGRQRRTYNNLFIKSAKTGEFVTAY